VEPVIDEVGSYRPAHIFDGPFSDRLNNLIELRCELNTSAVGESGGESGQNSSLSVINIRIFLYILLTLLYHLSGSRTLSLTLAYTSYIYEIETSDMHKKKRI
jgi:hypothetical protein